jgi:hypothetical protein
MLLNTKVDIQNNKIYHPDQVVVEVDHKIEQQNKLELIVCIEAGTLTKYHPYHLIF